MRLLVFGDFHGVLQKIPETNFDAVISAGDFFGLSPRAYRESLKLRMLYFAAENTQNPLLKKRLLKVYAQRGKLFERMVKKEEPHNFKRARRILEYLNSLGKPVFVIPGNWECFPPFFGSSREYHHRMQRYQELKQGLKNIVEMHLQQQDFSGFSIVGLGLCQMPENIFYHHSELAKRMYKDKKHLRLYNHWMRKMRPLFVGAQRRKKPILFISHNQPYNTSLDIINNKDSPAHGEHYGSCVTRKLIEDFQPFLCLGAHIHETKGTCRVGKTLCVNPGFGGAGEYAVIDIQGKKVQVQFRSNKNKKKDSKRKSPLSKK